MMAENLKFIQPSSDLNQIHLTKSLDPNERNLIGKSVNSIKKFTRSANSLIRKMKQNKKPTKKEEDGNIEGELDLVDTQLKSGGHYITEDDEMDHSIENDIEEADKEMEYDDDTKDFMTKQEEEDLSNFSKLDEESVKSIKTEQSIINEELSSKQETDFNLNQELSANLEDDIENKIEDSSDIHEEKDEDILGEPVHETREEDKSQSSSFSSQSSSQFSESSKSGESQTEKSEDQEIVNFGEDQEDNENESQDVEELEETASQKTREELENEGNEEDLENDVQADESSEEAESFDEAFESLVDETQKKDPTAKSVVVVVLDKKTQEPEIKNINIKDFREKTFKHPKNPNNITTDDLIEEDLDFDTKQETEKTGEDHDVYFHQEVENMELALENKLMKDHHNTEQHEHVKSLPEEKNEIEKNPKIQVFKKVSIEEEIKNPEDTNNPENDNLQYAQDNYKNQKAQKIFAEKDAFARATMPLPEGVPAQVFFSDLMGVSGVGEYKPSPNMIHYYGVKSGFQGHFAHKANSSISFEDVDVLVGLLSDINGIFHTIFNMLPSKKDAEKEREIENKSNFDKAYEVLKFYSRVRGFINVLVNNRELLVKDIKFLKEKVQNLHTGEEDMLKFYDLEVDFARLKAKSIKYGDDEKVKAHIHNITETSYDFERNVKNALKSMFTLEKTIIFFDNDARELFNIVKIENPIQAIQTFDRSLLFITKLLDIKVDLFKSMIDMKESLEALKSDRHKIEKEINSANKLCHYYELTETVQIPGTLLVFLLYFIVLGWKEE